MKNLSFKEVYKYIDPVDEEDFNVLIGNDPWEVKYFNYIPLPSFPKFSTFANFALGSASSSLATTSIYGATYYGGIHIPRLELNPAKNEPGLNFDHYIFIRNDHSYSMWKNSKDEHHWPKEDDQLFNYLPEVDREKYRSLCKI